MNLSQYRIAKSSGQQAILEWHAVHEESREFSEEELSELSVAITDYVTPIVRYNQKLKVQIYGAASEKILEEIKIIYNEDLF